MISDMILKSDTDNHLVTVIRINDIDLASALSLHVKTISEQAVYLHYKELFSCTSYSEYE